MPACCHDDYDLAEEARHVAAERSREPAGVLRRATLSGAGIGMLPTCYLGDDLRAGQLVLLLPDYEPEVLGIHAIYLSRQHQPLALRLLVDFLASRFNGDQAPWDLALKA